MQGFDLLARFLILVGLFLLLLGGLLWLLGRFPFLSFLGRLPGDIHVRGKHVDIYIPIVTSLLLSLVVTLLFNLILWLRHRP